MSTPHDAQRIADFRAWVRLAGGIEEAHARTGIGIRSLQRMVAGKQPPPAQLLERLAADFREQTGFELAQGSRARAVPARSIEEWRRICAGEPINA